MQRMSHPLFLRKTTASVLGIFAMIILVLSAVTPAYSLSFPYSNAVQIAHLKSGDIIDTWSGAACSYGGYFYYFMLDETNGSTYVSTSSDGATWSAPVFLFTATSVTATIQAGACEPPSVGSGSLVILAWMNNALGVNKYRESYRVCTMNAGTVSCNAEVDNALTTASALANCVTGGYIGWIEFASNGQIVQSADCFAGGFSLFINFYASYNASASSIQPAYAQITSGQWVFFYADPSTASQLDWATSSDGGVTWTVNVGHIADSNGGTLSVMLNGAGAFDPYTGQIWVGFIDANSGGSACASSGCVEVAQFRSNAFYSLTNLFSLGRPYDSLAVSWDGQNRVVVMQLNQAASTSAYAWSDNLGTSYTSNRFTSAYQTGGLVEQPYSHIDPQYDSSAFVLGYLFETGGAYYWEAQLFGLPTSPSGSSTQTQTIGSCPAAVGKGHNHYYTLTNATQFWYSGNALGQEAVNTVQTEVANIKGSGSHTLNLAIYGTAGSLTNGQAPNIQNPASLLYLKSYVITAGTVNSTITVQVSIPLNSANTLPLPFNFWAVSISGDDHIYIYNSTLSGMTSQSGLPTASSFYTSVGASSTNKFDLCATASYQSVLVRTQTIATTQSATSTVLVTSVQTNIVAGLIPSTVNYSLLFFVVLFPGVVLAFVMGVVTKSPGGAGIGFVAGMTAGAGLGLQAGLLPNAGVLAALLIVDIFIMIGVFASRGGGV